MKRGICPKCSCNRIYVVAEVRQPSHDSINGIETLHVATFAVPAEEAGLPEPNKYRAAVGTFEALVCAQCGFTEWYAKDAAAALERLLGHRPNVGVSVLGQPPGTPFR